MNMTEDSDNIANGIDCGLNKIGIGFILGKYDDVESLKWKVMQSIIATAIVAGAIKLDVRETDEGTVVSGYMYVEKNLSIPTPEKYGRFPFKVISEAREKYPFLNVVLDARLPLRRIMDAPKID